MADDENTWQAPEVTPLTEAEGASEQAEARLRNGVSTPVRR